MYTKCKDVEQIVKDCLNGISIEDIFIFARKSKIKQEQIIPLVLEEGKKHNCSIDEIKCQDIFNIYFKTLNIYKKDVCCLRKLCK